MIGITVSTNYHCELKEILEKNSKFFKKWYIVTSSDDEKTIKICSLYSNVETIFFNFKSDAIFNKGGALLKAQQIAHQKHPDEIYCILDSDIIIPDRIISFANNDKWENEEQLIGCARVSIDQFNEISTLKDDHACLGYLQIYKNKNKFYNNSNTCEYCDYEFSNIFDYKIMINDVYAFHIGECRKNWNGKND
jgi:hypothetical protein